MSQSKWRSTFVGVLVALVGGMAFAPAASAHYLTKAQAESRAREWAQQTVKYGDNSYTYSEVVCDRNSQALAHRRGCTLMYDTPASRPTSEWACVQRIQIWYQAHNDGDPPPSYTRFATAKDAKGNYFTHPCWKSVV